MCFLQGTILILTFWKVWFFKTEKFRQIPMESSPFQATTTDSALYVYSMCCLNYSFYVGALELPSIHMVRILSQSRNIVLKQHFTLSCIYYSVIPSKAFSSLLGLKILNSFHHNFILNERGAANGITAERLSNWLSAGWHHHGLCFD